MNETDEQEKRKFVRCARNNHSQAYPWFGIIVDDNCPVEKVQLKTFGHKRKYIQSLTLHQSQCEVEHTEVYTVFEYLLRPTDDFCQELLSHGDEVEVLTIIDIVPK